MSKKRGKAESSEHTDGKRRGRGVLLMLALVAVVAILALTRHDGQAGPAPNPYVNSVTMRGHDNTQRPRTWKAYQCAKRLAPMYVKIGASVNKYGSAFSLTNQPDREKFFIQQAGILNVRLSGRTAVEAIIVLSKAPFYSADTDFAGHENDKLAPVQHIQPGQSLTYTLHTDNYVHEQAKGDIINAVTLCLTRPQHTPTGTSAKGRQWSVLSLLALE